jgi:hypothetical protein
LRVEGGQNLYLHGVTLELLLAAPLRPLLFDLSIRVRDEHLVSLVKLGVVGEVVEVEV